MSVSPFPFALPAGKKKAASCRQGCGIPLGVEEGFWSSLTLGAGVFLNLTAPVKPATNDLQVGQWIRSGQWSNNSAECLFVLLLTAAWIFSVFLPLFHFSVFPSVEPVTFVSLSQLCLSGVSQYKQRAAEQHNYVGYHTHFMDRWTHWRTGRLTDLFHIIQQTWGNKTRIFFPDIQ